ncbi:hypothetical protein WN51_08657 [Melipona quadrifasciata]|uniref:Uncharacterized protein n=1 Tax=Melipona quadrifasciata TaxID=166423 RepID=A0A0N0BJE6_9HYME|nr:hypothetical protein WN51_08657 [Melipona quadrifasciata]
MDSALEKYKEISEIKKKKKKQPSHLQMDLCLTLRQSQQLERFFKDKIGKQRASWLAPRSHVDTFAPIKGQSPSTRHIHSTINHQSELERTVENDPSEFGTGRETLCDEADLRVESDNLEASNLAMGPSSICTDEAPRANPANKTFASREWDSIATHRRRCLIAMLLARQIPPSRSPETIRRKNYQTSGGNRTTDLEGPPIYERKYLQKVV